MKSIAEIQKIIAAEDLHEALALLQVAGPNPLLIEGEEYWARYDKLTNKYYPPEDDEE